MEKLWRAYQKKFSYAADLSWHTAMESSGSNRAANRNFVFCCALLNQAMLRLCL